MTALSVATWNINSVRLRAPLVERLLREKAPDVLCLQETKCPDPAFPHAPFEALGYRHRAIRGEKGYNGLAVLSKRPIEPLDHRDFCVRGDCRHMAVRVDGIAIHNLYVPAGGDVPDPVANPKFAHKLAFLDEMASWFAPGGGAPEGPSILVGDLNVAPGEQDVWSHRQLLRIVSHTPVETAKLDVVRAAGGWIDAARRFVPEDEKLYSWWSYRAKDWAASDKGRRLDHVWVSPDLGERLVACETLKEARGWPQPSDHAPVIATLG